MLKDTTTLLGQLEEHAHPTIQLAFTEATRPGILSSPSSPYPNTSKHTLLTHPLHNTETDLQK